MPRFCPFSQRHFFLNGFTDTYNIHLFFRLCRILVEASGIDPYCHVPQAHPDHGSCLAVSALPLHPPGELGPAPHPQILALVGTLARYSTWTSCTDYGW